MPGVPQRDPDRCPALCPLRAAGSGCACRRLTTISGYFSPALARRRTQHFNYDGSVSRSCIASTFVSVCVLLTGASPQKIPPTSATSLPICGPLVQLVLSCPLLGFAYKVPFG